MAPRILKRLIEINASDAGLIDNVRPPPRAAGPGRRLTTGRLLRRHAQDECLPLHCVCLGKSPSREAITLLHGAFPDGAKASESVSVVGAGGGAPITTPNPRRSSIPRGSIQNGHLPLHAYLEAHEPADPDIVRCLLDLYPAAASVADDVRRPRVPQSYMLSCAFDVDRLCLSLVASQGGLLPLHIALRHKATFGVVQMILTANDSAVVYGDGDVRMAARVRRCWRSLR